MVEAPPRYPNLVRGALSAILTGCARYLSRLPGVGSRAGRFFQSLETWAAQSSKHWKNRPPRFARWYYPGRPPASAPRCHASCSYPQPPCTAPVTGRASPSLRSGTSRASCSVVGDVERPRCRNALPILAASRLARSPMPTPASGLVMPRACPRRLGRPRGPPNPPALPTRNPERCCKRSSHALPPPRHCTCEAGSCRAPPPGWHCGCGAASFQPPSPAAVPGGPDTGHASEAVMSCAQSPGAPCPQCYA